MRDISPDLAAQLEPYLNKISSMSVTIASEIIVEWTDGMQLDERLIADMITTMAVAIVSKSASRLMESEDGPKHMIKQCLPWVMLSVASLAKEAAKLLIAERAQTN